MSRGVYTFMKSYLPLLPVLTFVVVLITSPRVLADPTVVPLDDVTAPANDAVGQTGTGAAQTQKGEKIREAFKQLNLTDAQKQQMMQIHQNVTDQTERRKQIMAVLTPDQRQQLMQTLKNMRSGT